jgi:hypothetical protein
LAFSRSGSRTSVARASHAILGKLKQQEMNVTVLDEMGNDVTPVSLSTNFKNGPAKAASMPAEASIMASITKVCD